MPFVAIPQHIADILTKELFKLTYEFLLIKPGMIESMH